MATTMPQVSPPTLDSVEQEIEQLRSNLDPLVSARAADPGLTDLAETDLRVPAAKPTSDPHRITFVVPTPDDAVMSLGAPGPANRIADIGITGRTKTHIHWVTTAGPSQTLVTLGGPATSATTASHGDKVATTSEGFAMLTDGRAWLDAKGQFGALSRESDIILRTASDKVASLQSDHGAVEVAAGNGATVAAANSVVIAADSGLETKDTAYGEEHHKLDVTKAMHTKVIKTLLAASDVVASFEALTLSFKKLSFKPKQGESVWTPYVNQDFLKLTLDAAKLASTTIRTIDDWSNMTGASKLGLYSSGYASMTGEIASSIYGHLSASVTSLLSASVLGGTASVKGLLFASVWAGLEASVKGRKDAKLEGENGKVSVKGLQGAEVSSKSGPVLVQGESDVQLNSTAKNAYVHGASKTYVGAGKGSGAGVTFDGSGELTVGLVKAGAEHLSKPVFDRFNRMSMTKGETRICVGKARLFVAEGNAALLSSPAHGIRASTTSVTVRSKGRVLLG